MNQRGELTDPNENLAIDNELAVFDFSHYPLPQKSEDIIRIFYNNINGLEINSAIAAVVNNKKQKQKHVYMKDIESYTKVESFIKQMTAWEVDISMVSEPCVEWRDVIPRKVITDIAKKYDKVGQWTVSTSKCYSGSFVKPGGSLIYTKGNMVGRIQEKGTDPWGYGRWSYVRYQGKGNSSLLVISAYRVGHRTDSAGSSTAWFQQKVLLTQEQREISPDMAFIVDMEEWYKSLNLDQTEVVFMLDANEQWSDNAHIKKLAQRLQLFNLNTDGEFGFPATHPCISNPTRDTTIDYCLCTRKVLETTRYATMAPFDLHSLGDHRGILIDLDITKIMSVKENTPEQLACRKLATGNVAATEKYLKELEKSFLKQNIYERVNKLYHKWKHKKVNKWYVAKKYERLDAEIFHLCKKAERKCRKSTSGNYAWSPQLSKAIKTLIYWKTRTKHGDENRIVKQIGQELDIPFEFYTKDEIQVFVNKSRERLTQVQSKAIEHRKKYLEDRATKYSEENNIAKARAITELLAHESVRSTFYFLREKLKKSHTGQLNKIWVAYDENGNYCKDLQRKIDLDKEQDVHSILLKRNKKHLGQAKYTPFARKPWSTQLKWDGTGDIGKDILSGDILNQRRFSRVVQLYFESLKTNKLATQFTRVTASLSLEEYKKFWKKKKEETVTSPFGLHVGHFKAAIQNRKILNVHRIMLLIPFQTAIVPSRWKRTVQTMLEKDSGQPWIHRLRIIELFDSQVNAGFQIFIGRKMVWSAVKNRTLHQASFGSTPGKMASSALLQKILSVDQLRLERKAGVLFDCDATGCYDRILPPLASVHLQALGLDESISTMLARLMYVAKRHVKTKHGVSKKCIRTTNNNPLFGIGQGNGGGPAIWLAHLTIMFSALSAICAGFVTRCIKNISELAVVGTGYVDDVTLIATADENEPQTEQSVRNKIKFMAQIWEKLLFITGGKLELSKCFWIPVIWRWKKGNPVIRKAVHGSKELLLTESESGQRITIPRVTPQKAEKRLGVWYSLDGQWKTEYKNWREFTTAFADKIQTARLDRLGGHHAYNTLWCAKFRYIAPVVSFTKQELDNIQKKIIGRSLAAAGYSAKMPRAVVFGPEQYGGMQWNSPYSIVVYEQLKILIGSLRLGDSVGKLLKLQIQWLQLHAGTSVPILEDTVHLSYLQKCWLTSLHKKMVESQVKILLAKKWIPKKRRQEDIIIMDYVRTYLPEDFWEPINQCRIYMNAITLSDLTTFDGSTIPASVYHAQGPYRKSRLRFPAQCRPNSGNRKKWQYLIHHLTDDKLKLLTPLGRWIKTPYQYYPFVMDTQRQFIFKLGITKWDIYIQQGDMRNHFKKSEIQTNKLPKKWMPLQAIQSSNGSLRGIFSQQNGDNVPESTSNIPGHITNETTRKILGTSSINEDQMTKLGDDWSQRQVELTCGCDGGLKETLGTSGYVIYRDPSESPLITGYSAETQAGTSASSTRQELLAQLCVEYWLNHLLVCWGQPKHPIYLRVITDSKASLIIMDNIQNIVGMKDVLRPDVDVALELSRMRKANIHCKLQLIKVTSHIDKQDAPDEIHWQVNHEADYLATLAREKVREGNLKANSPSLLEGAVAVVSIQDTLCFTEVKQWLSKGIYQEELEEYLMRKHDWDRQILNSIDWEAHAKALQSIPQLPRITAYKYIHRWLATTRRRWREGFFSTPQCALCDGDDTSDHIFTCTEERYIHARQTELEKLKKAIFEITDNTVGTAIMVGIRSVLDQYDMDTYSQEFVTNKALEAALSDQKQIGWKHFLRGRMSTIWKKIGPSDNFKGGDTAWSGHIAARCINFGINLWKHRNTIVHGNPGGTSKLEMEKTRMVIQKLYSEISPTITAAQKWLFSSSLEEKLSESYTVQVAWIDSVRRLFPDEYNRCKHLAGSSSYTQHNLEYLKGASAGMIGS